jgi:hypothetical protein
MTRQAYTAQYYNMVDSQQQRMLSGQDAVEAHEKSNKGGPIRSRRS